METLKAFNTKRNLRNKNVEIDALDIGSIAKLGMIIKEQEEEIRKIRLALSYYEDNKKTSGIFLPLTQDQKEMLFDLFMNYYKDDMPVEYQIIHYLIEDVFTVHHNLEDKNSLNTGIRQCPSYSVKKEAPYMRSSNSTCLFNAFREYKVTYRLLNQVKV